MWFFFSVLCGILIIVILHIKIVRPYQHWKQKRIPSIKPTTYFTNLFRGIFRKRPYPYFLQDVYNRFPDKRYAGLHESSTPILMLRDLELIKQITIKDFNIFSDRQPFLPKDVDPFWNRNLLALSGERWRSMRDTLSPAFTSSKMKAMFVLIRQSAKQFTDHFLRTSGTTVLEMKDTFSRFTNDVSANTIFGVTCDSIENGDNEFYLTVKQASTWGGIKKLKLYGYSICPLLMGLLKVSFFEEHVKLFFHKNVMNNLKLREEQNIIRPDMLQLLMDAKKGRLQFGEYVKETSIYPPNPVKPKVEITDEDITAQALIFFLGGFDTSSTLMSFLAYELAVNPNIQARLRQEIDITLKNENGEISYDALLGMSYMDMVLTETLRKWPPSILASRIANRPFVIEPENCDEVPLQIETGTVCWIPIYAIHRDPKYYPDPDSFSPERFNKENKTDIKPSAFLPFGEGPRNCIGSRFAVLSTKTIIFYLLSDFEIIPVAQTEIPLPLSKYGASLTSANGIWLGLKPR